MLIHAREQNSEQRAVCFSLHKQSELQIHHLDSQCKYVSRFSNHLLPYKRQKVPIAIVSSLVTRAFGTAPYLKLHCNIPFTIVEWLHYKTKPHSIWLLILPILSGTQLRLQCGYVTMTKYT